MNICITGITGFVGGALANHFAQHGHDVVGIGRKCKPPPHIDHRCSYIRADISTEMPRVDADVFIHAGALASDTATYDDLYATNVTGTTNVLHAARGASTFLYISSSSVYDYSTPFAIEKEGGRNFNRLSAYGQTKFLAEHTVQQHSSIPRKIILRPRAIYGVHDQVLLPRLLKLVKNKKVVLPKHVAQKISLTHIDNLVGAVALCLKQQHPETCIYNVADAEPYSLQDVLLTLLPAVTNGPLTPFWIPKRVWEMLIDLNEKIRFNPALNQFAAASLTSNAVLDISAIRAIGYAPLFNFNNSFPQIAEWIHQTGGWRAHLIK